MTNKSILCVLVLTAFAAAPLARAQVILVNDSFTGSSLPAGYSAAGTAGTTTVSGGSADIALTATANADKETLARTTGDAGGYTSTYNGNPVFDFYDNPETLTVGGLQFAGTPGSSASGGIVYFFGVASPNTGGYPVTLAPYNAADGLYFALKYEGGSGGDHLFAYSTVAASPTAVDLGTLSGLPTGLSIDMNGDDWTATLTGATISGTSYDTSSTTASYDFNSSFTASSFSAFDLATGVYNNTASNTDPSMLLSSLEVQTDAAPEPSVTGLMAVGLFFAGVVAWRRGRAARDADYWSSQNSV